ncbi:Glycoprotein Xg, partial [Myotis brandtii]
TQPRSRAQTSTQSRNPHIPRSPQILIPVEKYIFIEIAVHEFVHQWGGPSAWPAGSAETGSPTSPEGSQIARGRSCFSLTPAGNTVATIVSPIVSVVVVTLVGAAVGYFQRNRRRNCFRGNEPEHV